MPREMSVIVVHGVGDPLPGSALGKLVEGLTAAGCTVEQPACIEHQPDGIGTPACPVARAGLLGPDGQQRLRLREVYWGDLSRPKASLFGLVSALFDLIFGLRYIVTAATSQLSGVALVGAQLARAALWWARGPMFALNIIAATVCLTWVALQSVSWPGGRPLLSAPLTAVLAGTLLVFGAGWIVRYRARQLHWSPATGDAMIVLAPIAAVAGWWVRARLDQNLDVFIGTAAGSSTGISDAMVVAALLMAAAALASGVLCLAGAWTPAYRRPLIAVTFCTTLALGLFTFVVVAMWALIGKAIREDTADRALRCLKSAAARLQDCLDSKIDATAGTALAGRIEAGIHLLPWVVFAFGGMAVCFLLVWLRNRIRAWRGRVPDRRYIISTLVFWCGVVLSMAYGGFFVWLACSLLLGTQGPPAWVQAEELKPAALALTVAIAGAVVATRAQFLTALDLILDVIAHFRYEGGNLLGKGREYVVWKQTLARFRRVLHDELRRSDRGVVVISHSQGTTIAAQALGALTVTDLPVTPAAAASQRVRLLTMGSPIEHLYVYYMPSRYRVQPDAVTRWDNLYREDDFIGTTIGALGGDGGTNLGPGGHSDYWTHPEVARRVLASAREAAHHAVP